MLFEIILSIVFFSFSNFTSHEMREKDSCSPLMFARLSVCFLCSRVVHLIELKLCISEADRRQSLGREPYTCEAEGRAPRRGTTRRAKSGASAI